MRQVVITKSGPRPFAFTAPFTEDYALLLVLATPDISPEERSSLADQIVHTPCRYVSCFGHECEEWHDIIDWSHLDIELAPHTYKSAPPDFELPLLMTTDHENEEIESVVDFWWEWAKYNDHPPERLAVFVIGNDQELETRLHARLAHWQNLESSIR